MMKLSTLIDSITKNLEKYEYTCEGVMSATLTKQKIAESICNLNWT
jgi:hypothetical protein